VSATTTIQGAVAADGSGMPPGSESRKLIAVWESVIQNSTQSTPSKRMICLVTMVLSAKNTAEARPAAWPISSGETPGWATTSTPRKPSPAAMALVRVMRSPSISGARTVTQSGLVNSSATSWESGMAATAKNQRFWPA
jgi:hypothetical protein